MSLPSEVLKENKTFVVEVLDFTPNSSHPVGKLIIESVFVIKPKKNYILSKNGEKIYYNTFDLEIKKKKEIDIFEEKNFYNRKIEIIELTNRKCEYEIDGLFKIYLKKDVHSTELILEMKNVGVTKLRDNKINGIVDDIVDQKMLLAYHYENHYINYDFIDIAEELKYYIEWENGNKYNSNLRKKICELKEILRRYPNENETTKAIQNEILEKNKEITKREAINGYLIKKVHEYRGRRK